MSTYTTSRGTRGQHVSPRFESRPYRMAPWTREHIYKPIVGIPDRRDWSAPIFIALALIVGGFFVIQMMRGM